MGEKLDVRNWHTRALCPRCQWSSSVPNGDLFYLAVDACPRCGEDKWGPMKNGRRFPSTKWNVVTARYVWERAKFVLWKPSTWRRTGHWEVIKTCPTD